MESTSYNDRVHSMLLQIKDAIAQLTLWNKDVLDSEDYYRSPEGMKLLAASCMLIEAIGESVNQIEKQTEGLLFAARPEIPWHDVIGIRNHIAHGYFDIDGDIVFEVVKHDLQPLSNAIDYFLSLWNNSPTCKA